jgi:hypothetical protein
VLKPAKPLPVGKKVKCPKCGTDFTVTEEASADGPAPPKPAARAKPAPARKKPATAQPAPKKSAPARPAPKRPADDDDDEGGAYALVRDPDLDPDPEDEDEEPKKPKIDYAPDLSIKDLRGPAMELIVKPSNYLIFQGMFGGIGWLGFLVLVLIPILFPLDYGEKDKDKDKNKAAPPPAAVAGKDKDKDKDAKKTEADHSFFEIFGWRFAHTEDEDWSKPFILILSCILGLLYAGTVTFGAIKIQNMESRRWGIASSIMALLPFASMGFGLFAGILLQVLFRMLFDEESMVMIYLGAFLGLLWTYCVGVAVWNLKTLMMPEVIAGFEYVPD